jgi:hypothetical protein
MGAAPVLLLACTGDDPVIVSTPADDGGGSGTDTSSPTTDASDATPADAGPPCDLTKPFANPVALEGVNSPAEEVAATLSSDELTCYFARSVDGGAPDLYVASRKSTALPFSGVTLLQQVNTAFRDDGISTTGDALTIYFHSDRPDSGVGSKDIYRATRPSLSTSLGAPSVVESVNSTAEDFDAFVLPNGKTLYFSSNRSGTAKLYRSDWVDGGFGAPSYLSELNDAFVVVESPIVSDDGLVIYFASGPSHETVNVWSAKRSSPLGAFENPAAVAELASSNEEVPAWISPDDCRLYFRSTRAGGPGGRDIWMATRAK